MKENLEKLRQKRINITIIPLIRYNPKLFILAVIFPCVSNDNNS